MNTFLHDVASGVFSHYGDELPKITMVFASRRAQIYFNAELQALTDLKPRVTTIDKWILGRVKDIEHPSKFLLVAKLYEVYSKYHKVNSLDEFYSFGEMLLSDFDMIDRYMVDTNALFCNVASIKDLEADFFADEESRMAAMKFWESFDKESATKAAQLDFSKVWHSLKAIYQEFNELLDSSGLAYSGKTYRKVAGCEFEHERKTVIVGLNALSTSEKEIFRALKKLDNVDFIWDYDPSWLGGENNMVEAGFFIERNIAEFPQADYFTTAICPHESVDVEVITSPSDVMQAKAVTALIEEIDPKQNTAIILTDEGLLIPLLRSLPQSVAERLNISIGYPLVVSPIGRLLDILVKLHGSARNDENGTVRFKRIDIQPLLYNKITNSESLTTLFNEELSTYIDSSKLAEATPTLASLWHYCSLHDYLKNVFEALSNEELDERDKVFVDSILSALSSLEAIMAVYGKAKITRDLYRRLLDQVIAQQRIDFEGYSGAGVQVMGILESRSLDFDRVILLSLSDDNFPSSRPDNSYIPQMLLQGFSMPSIVEKSAIWSCYFYRLFQRSSRLSLLYCNVADGLSTGEPSRYILQLKYGGLYSLHEKTIALPPLSVSAEREISIEKSEEMLTMLKNQRYSPSSLLAYIKCPLQFYFRYIEKLREPDKADESEISGAELGNIVHRSLEQIYEEKCATDRARVEEIIEAIMVDEVPTKLQTTMAEVVRAEAKSLVHNVLIYDTKVDDFACFHSFEQDYDLFMADSYKLWTKIDRVDLLTDGSHRIIDYKTGSVILSAPSIEAIFEPLAGEVVHNEKRVLFKEMFQILFYCYLFYKKYRTDTEPVIYAVRKMSPYAKKGYSGRLTIDGQEVGFLSVEQYDLIEKQLMSLLDQINSAELPFRQTLERKSCTYCPYAPICNRQ